MIHLQQSCNQPPCELSYDSLEYTEQLPESAIIPKVKNRSEPETPQNESTVHTGDLVDHPLIQLFGDRPKTRFIAVLHRHDHPLTVSDLCEKAAVDRATWYNHKDALFATKLVEDVSDKSYAQLRLVPSDRDARHSWLGLIEAVTSECLRTGERPTFNE